MGEKIKNRHEHRNKSFKNRNGKTRYEKGRGIYTMEGKNPLKIRRNKRTRSKYKDRDSANPTFADIWPEQIRRK